MVDINRDIFLILKDIARVELEFPGTDAKFPVITITEVTNTEDYSVEGVERISDITYQIDVWDNGGDPRLCNEIAAQVSSLMTKKIFKRTLGRGFRDASGLWRNMMYFTGKTLNKGEMLYG